MTPWTAARQTSLSITNPQSPPKPMSIESVMPSNHLILCHPLLLLPSMFPSIRVFSNESSLHPWFMDLTFQVPMQYCSLQHRTFLLSPVPSTTGCCFCFGSIPSFFLELFLHWSPVTYWTPTYWTWRVYLSVSYLFAFSYCSWGSQGKNTEVVCHALLHGPHSVRPLHHDLSVLGGPTRQGLISLS